MARIIIETDDGRRVAEYEVEYRALGSIVKIDNPRQRAVKVANIIERDVRDAELIERDIDPERPSEKAMRLAFGGS